MTNLDTRLTGDDNTVIKINLQGFSEAEWIMNNSQSLFKSFGTLCRQGESNCHWLDGYNPEPNGRNTFHWACLTLANTEQVDMGLPQDLLHRWKRWLDKDEQKIFTSFAIKASEVLTRVLIDIMRKRTPQKYIDYIGMCSYVLCRLIEYPDSKGDLNGRGLLALEHYDPSLLTLLYSATQAGLEIEGLNKEWIEMPNTGKDSLILYGRWLEYVDSDIKATLHRVRRTCPKKRYSLQCFLLTDGEKLASINKNDKHFAEIIEKIKSHFKHTFIEYEPTKRWTSSLRT